MSLEMTYLGTTMKEPEPRAPPPNDDERIKKRFANPRREGSIFGVFGSVRLQSRRFTATKHDEASFLDRLCSLSDELMVVVDMGPLLRRSGTHGLVLTLHVARWLLTFIRDLGIVAGLMAPS